MLLSTVINIHVACAAQVAALPAQAVAYAMDTRNRRRWNLCECATRLLALTLADSAGVLAGVAVQVPSKNPAVRLRARDVPVNQRRGGRPSNAGSPTTNYAGYGRVRAWMRGWAGVLIVSEREAISGEIELIERAKVEAEAFGILYDRYVRTVFAFAFSKVRDQAQAEDLTSQTFLQALKALPRYQQRGLPFRSWLLRITANLITDQHRAAAPTQSLQERPRGLGDTEDDTPSYDPPDPHAQESIAAWEGVEDFEKLIAGLTEEQQEVLRLRFVEGLAIGEIAEQLHRTEGSVKMLLLRGLQQLRRSVGPAYFATPGIGISDPSAREAQRGGAR